MKFNYLFTGIYNTTYVKYLKKKLDNDGWEESKKKIDLLFFFHNNKKKYDHEYYNIKTNLQNILSKGNNGAEVITDKYKLYFNMLKYEPYICKKHMMKSYTLDKDFIVKNKKIYIIKPVGVGFFSGNGITIVTSQQEYDNTFSKLKSDKYIISEYLTNPLLLNKKKFHLRVYFLVSNLNNKVKWSILNIFKVITSELEYKNSDYTNSNIHDTHIRHNIKDIFLDKKSYKKFNINVLEYQKITNQIYNILKSVFNIVKDHAKPYENATNAFEIFGCDFLVDLRLIVYLLEINDHIGHNFINSQDKIVIRFQKKMSNWIYTKIIYEIFYSKK